MRVRDQQKALELIDGDADLLDLRHLRAPYLDLEVRRLRGGCGCEGWFHGRVTPAGWRVGNQG